MLLTRVFTGVAAREVVQAVALVCFVLALTRRK
jgi:hypothetical protein